ncbi:MAG: tetratricopeptide repeat protein [Planctomycetes bacterium]|nr:tetratricopeptide repeat protein [Planctomycetota bacterium]
MKRSSIAIVAFLSLFVVVQGICVASDQGERERAFVKGLEAFDSAKSSGDYRQAALLFESILDDGYRSGAVYYNLGNTYYRAGQYGLAILNYRKAKPYRPRDPYLLANLQQALTVAPGRLAETPLPWYRHVLFWSEWISLPTKVQVISLIFVLAAISMVLSVYFRRTSFRYVTMVLLVISTLLTIDAAICYRETMANDRAVIISETNALKGTGQNYEPAFDQPLRDGAEFQILSETNGWIFGHFEGIGDGWIRQECVAR